MIDRAARKTAAALVRAFRDGRITNDEYEDGLPLQTDDAAIHAIWSHLWFYYDDTREHRMDDRLTSDPELRDLFTRCAEFLETDIAYAWPHAQFIQISGCLARVWGAFAVTLALMLAASWFSSVAAGWALLAWPLLYAVGRMRAYRFEQRMTAFGDLDCWPFRSNEERLNSKGANDTL